MDNYLSFDFQSVGYKPLIIEDSPIYLSLTFEYTTSKYTLSEFANLLSGYLGLDSFEFRSFEVVNSKKNTFK